MNLMSDLEGEVRLIRRVGAGDRDAFQDLYLLYERRLGAYLWRVLGNAELVEETANDVLFAIWRQASRYEEKSKPSTWIFGVAHHKAMDALRRRRARPQPLEEAREVPAREMGTLNKMAILEALARLPEEQREALHMAFYQEMPYEEIAAATRCPVNTVKTRIFHARKKLEQWLGRNV